MKKASLISMLPLLLAIGSAAYAETVIEEFKIEGLISPASPKALKSALEEKLQVKVVGLNLKNTESGWPVIQVQFDSTVVSKDKIEQVIAATADPAGQKYKVHKGPLNANAALLEEEQKAVAMLGPKAEEIPNLTNPIPASDASAARGKQLYENNCAKCHGLSGNGYGPSTHAFTTHVRPLWVWGNADASADGYLFWFITNGRTDMPPWGLILSENERWDLVNYIRTMKALAKE
jgi:mono/diheme cytochrome c family protein